jgi:hypothetical protein
MNHDCGKECAAAVREATAPLEELLRASTRENLNLKDRLAELTRCRTAADLQHARERRPGYPWNGAKFSRSDLIA